MIGRGIVGRGGGGKVRDGSLFIGFFRGFFLFELIWNFRFTLDVDVELGNFLGYIFV